EALDLRWSDVDFESGRIAVRASKTEAGVADVPLLPALAHELRAHRERQARHGFDRINAEALIFTTATGQPQNRRNALRAINRAGERAKLQPEGSEPIGPHDLRHSLAANAFALGATLPDVSKLLRHANTQVTASTYAGVAGDHVEQLATKLAGLGGAS